MIEYVAEDRPGHCPVEDVLYIFCECVGGIITRGRDCPARGVGGGGVVGVVR